MPRGKKNPTRVQPAAVVSPWTVRYSPRLLTEDLRTVGHAAFELAREAVEKKLQLAPDQYGAPLGKPLHGLRKLETADLRIVYRVDEAPREVLVLMIGNRRDIWAEFQAEILDRDAALAAHTRKP